MKLSNWKHRLLSGMLCACMVFQSLTLNVYAGEVNAMEPVVEIQETEAATEAEAETVAEAEAETVEEVTNETEEVTTGTGSMEGTVMGEPAAELLSTTVSTGTFSNVNIEFGGYNAYVTSGTFTYNGTDTGAQTTIYMKGYDAEDVLRTNIVMYSFSGTEANTYDLTNYSMTLHPEVTKVRLEAEITIDGTAPIVTEYFIPDAAPNFTMSAEVTDVGASFLELYISYSGDMDLSEDKYQYVNVELSFKADGADYWKSQHFTLSCGDDFNLLDWKLYLVEPDTTYSVKARFYVEAYDNKELSCVNIWEQTIDLGTFTTKENKSYNVKEAFPDDVLRAYIIEHVNSLLPDGEALLTDDSDVMTTQLEEIEGVDFYRSDATTAAVKDLTGIELLEELRYLRVEGNEIDSVDTIDWSALPELRVFDLSGNNLIKAPDLSQNAELVTVDLGSNCLSEAEIAAAKLPTGVTNFYTYTQRAAELALTLEPNYYIYDTKVPLIMEVEGLKTFLTNQTYKLLIDGVEQEMALQTNYWPVRIAVEDSALAAGEHTVKLEVYGGETKLNETVSYTFNVVDEPIFTLEDKIYLSTDDNSSIELNLYFDAAKTLSKVQLINNEGIAYAENSVSPYLYNVSGDPRYTAFYTQDQVLNRARVYVLGTYNAYPVGSYHIKAVFSDGTYAIIEDAVEVVSADKTILENCYIGYNYDNTGDYIYLMLEGSNIDPDRLDIQLSQNGTLLPTTVEGSKGMTSGVVVKLKKNGWDTLLTYNGVEVAVTPKEGYETFGGSINTSVYMSSGIYYAAYNYALDRLEIAVSEGLNSENQTVKVEVREGHDTEIYPIIAEGSAVVSDGVAYIDLMVGDTKFSPERRNYYFNYIIENSITMTQSMYLSPNKFVANANYWHTDVALMGSNFAYAYYYTDVPYPKTDDEVANLKGVFSAELTNADGSVRLEPNRIMLFSASGNVAVGLEYDISKLAVGTYTLHLYQQGEDIGKTGTLNIQSGDKFILNSVSAQWMDKTQFRVYLNTLNYSEKDDYEIIVTDVYGNVVEGLTVSELSRGNNNVQYAVKGLKYEEAMKKYYIKVLHKTYGEPINGTGGTYYSDEKGQYLNISYYKGGYTSKVGRLIGLNMQGIELPAKFQIFKPYDTQIIAEETITSDSLQNVSYFYINKELYDTLPDPDVVYQVVMTGADNFVQSYNQALGYFDAAVEKVWGCVISRDTLYLNDEAENTAVIQVSNYKKAPTFKSSDTSVATVTVTEEGKAEVKAVGIGVAEITITADGITKTLGISVERKIVVEDMVLNETELTLTVGEVQELIAAILPAEAWSEEQTITFTSSNEEVVAIIDGDMLQALSAGTATITATLDGTDFTKTCEVTVINVYDEDAKESIIASAGTTYVLLNTFSSSTVTLKDVVLPEGFNWVDGNIKLAADNSAPIQYFMATYQAEGYEPFDALLPVAVSKLTKITLSGNTNLVTGCTDNYTIKYVYTGYQASDEFDGHYDIQWTAAGTAPFVTIADADKSTAVITAVEVTAKKAQTVNVVIAIDGNSKKTFKASLKMNVLEKPYVDYMALSEALEQPETTVNHIYDAENQIVEVDWKDVSTAKGAVKNTLSFAVEATAGGEATATKMKWTSSDTSVAAIKADKDTLGAVVTIKKAGTAVISVTANDGDKLTKQIIIDVKDYMPVLESNKLTVNVYSTERVVLPLKEQNENVIQNVEILEDGEVSDKLIVTKTDAGYEVKVAENADITKKTTVKAVLKLTTEKGVYEDSKKQAITITLDTAKPTATLKQLTKANLFYTGATATYIVNSKYEIAAIEDVTEYDGLRFHASYDARNGKITFHTNGELSNKNVKEFTDKATKKQATTVTLKVKFAGYTEEADKLITVTVGTENKPLSLKLNDIILVPGMTESTTQVYDTKAKEDVALSASYIVLGVSDTAKTGDVAVEFSGDRMKVSYDGTANATYKVELAKNGWTKALTLQGKITMAKEPTLVLDSTKVTLNTATSVQQNGKMTIGVSVKNHDAEIKGITYKADKNSAKLFNQGYLYFTYDEANQQLLLGLNQGKGEGIKDGSYKITLGGTVEVGGQEIALKGTTLTVTLTSKAPTVKLAAKGSIDLVQRENTSIVYTPTLSNVMAKVADVKLTGSYTSYFDAEVENGKIYVHATDKPMSTKITYAVGMVLTLDNGMEVSATVKIKPVNKLPKVTPEATKATLYKAGDKDVTFGVNYNVAAAEIANITQVADKTSKYFDFTYDAETEMITVSLSEEAVGLKPGKYTVSYAVYFEGAAYNVKPVTVKLAVTVK